MIGYEAERGERAVKTRSQDVINVGANIRSTRESLNISIRELAQRAGLSYAAIWKVETGRMAPTVVVLYKIARALNRKVTELLDPVLGEDDVVYAPRRSRTQARGGGPLASVERISASSQDWILQGAEYILQAGARSGRAPMTHRGELLAYCLEGKVRYTLNGKEYDLEPGDAIHVKALLPRFWKNIHNGVSRLLVVVVPPRVRDG